MTYQVLARKWRPRSFADLVGQEHVVRALVNGLQRGQLHHAYLFTGTRGVGKTTLARILAKTLNCESGVGPEPCGQCTACTEIDAGRFVDLLEVDAASRTKVDQTRELLDNVPFSPVRGRYKVYLIDEVHMFSASSFNALLKTLEEPPAHVKFVLATTDPQKLPATILSRCLQFNLKRLLPDQIRERFVRVLEAEGIAHELPALTLLARAADGSMRDGLSLLDQAVAFGAGRIAVEDVRVMLGARGGELSLDLLEALAEADAPRLLADVGRIAELTPDFGSVLDDLIAKLHRVALVQQIPGALHTDDPDEARLLALSQHMPPEDVQLYYQILLTGQADLALAPDPRSGFEMLLLRALAFRPAVPAGVDSGVAAGSGGQGHEGAVGGAREAARSGAAPGSASAQAAISAHSGAQRADDIDAATARTAVATASVSAIAGPPALAGQTVLQSAADWERLVAGARLGGLALELARHCALQSWDGQRLCLALNPGHLHLHAAGAEERLRSALATALGCELRLEIRAQAQTAETPAQRRERESAQRLAEAEQVLQTDPVARHLRERFDAEWIPGTLTPRAG